MNDVKLCKKIDMRYAMYNIGICDDGENICSQIEDMLIQYAKENNIKIEVNKNSCNFITPNGNLWYNIKGLPITIRKRKNGDKIITKMGTISISDYLTNKKVPYLKRRNILLLCEKDNVIAILGYVIKK